RFYDAHGTPPTTDALGVRGQGATGMANGEGFRISLVPGSVGSYALTVHTGDFNTANGWAVSQAGTPIDSGTLPNGGVNVLDEGVVVFYFTVADAGEAAATWDFDILRVGGGGNAMKVNSAFLVPAAAADPLLVVADPIDFTTYNEPGAADIEITNAGATNDLTITAVNPGGADASNFSLVTLLPLVIPPGSSDFLDFDFTPNGTYQPTYTATVEIVSNDASSPKTVTLQVTNLPDPRIEVADQDFTNNGVAANYSVPVSNIGLTNDLNISNVTVGGNDGPATVSGLSYPAAITAAGSGTIDFTFTPDSGSGFYDIIFTIDSDDASVPSKDVAVSISVEDPVIAISSTILDFGVLPHAPGTQDLAVAITNAGGTETLTIVGGSTAISGNAAFTILSPALPIDIAPGATADLTVRFDPGTAAGRFSGVLSIDSTDYNAALPQVRLEALVAPAGTVVARFDFDPDQISGAIVDLDDSSMANWTTGDLTDLATGAGALSQGNQAAANRTLFAGVSGNFLAFSSNREGDAQTPLASGGNDESTWTTFTVTPESGGSINFTGGTAAIDTYARTDQGSNTAADWTLYYSTDGGSVWSSLGTLAGAATGTTNGTTGPIGLRWDLSSIGSQAGPVQFILDPVSTGATNGVATQRSVGFDNLFITAGTVTPGTSSNFASWAAGFGIPNDPAYDGTDHDGIPALIEYALGLNPNVAETLADSFDPATRVLSFAKGATAVANGDVSYVIETSTDLGVNDPWTPVPSYDPPDINDSSTISYTLPAGSGRLFARLVVSQNP
ncbi:MAG: choice-of-anchor D domain-containing protein, partial [Verrucomicrobiae bacterium]|nr:choice-of-anchor D domain-containing protein [Verrucomicrobiae bacterium]